MGRKSLCGQASAEFLVIFAAIFLVVVIGVVLTLGSSGSTDDTRASQSRNYWVNEKPIAITDAKAIQNGLTLVLKNTGPNKLQINSISVREEMISSPNVTPTSLPLEPGQSAKITVPAAYPPTGNYRFVKLNMRFDYTSQISKPQIGKELLIIPSPNTCNDILETCYSDLDCCNKVKCKYGACGGCGEQGQECNVTSDCCSGLVCNSGYCGQKPDLVPVQLSPYPQEGEIGPFDNISLRIANIGLGGAPASTSLLAWQLRNCPNPVLCSRELEIRTPGLGPGDAYDFATPFVCIDATNITLTADSRRQVDESNETNNFLKAGVSCSLPLLPDLVANASEAVLYGDAHYVGVPFDVPVTTTNIGGADAGNSSTEVRFAGVSIDSIPVGALAPGESYARDVTVNCTAPGNFQFQLDADEGKAVLESNEHNTVDYEDVVCSQAPAGPLPDYIPLPYYGLINNHYNRLFAVSLNTMNNGTGDAASWSLTKVMPPAGSPVPDISNASIPPLAAGAGNLSTFYLNCTPLGPYAYQYEVDFYPAPYGSVTESNETNNMASVARGCGLPDLVPLVNAAELAGPKYVGVPFNVNVTTRNQGSYNTELSTTTRVTFNNTLIQNINVPLLSYGFSPLSRHSQIVLVTCIAQGYFLFAATVDYDNAEEELSEYNNIINYQVNCVPYLGGEPNLVPEVNSLWLQMYNNSSQQLHFETVNIGLGETVNGSVTRVAWDGNGSMLTYEIPVPPLAIVGSPGSRYESPVPPELPCSSPGVKNLTITVDRPPSNVSETNETDNTAQYQVSCLPHPGGCNFCNYTVLLSAGSDFPQWVPHRAFSIDIIASPDAALLAATATDIHFDDYGHLYMNGQWQYYEGSAGPGTGCSNSAGGYRALSSINPAYGATNTLKFDDLDSCNVVTGASLNLNLNVSINVSGTCDCPPTPETLFTISDYHPSVPSCTTPREFSAECASGICSAENSCMTCKGFPGTCSSNSECCNNQCVNYNGTNRCAYYTHRVWAGVEECPAPYVNSSLICLQPCSWGCPSPLVCDTSLNGCRLPCATNTDCGPFTTCSGTPPDRYCG